MLGGRGGNFLLRATAFPWDSEGIGSVLGTDQSPWCCKNSPRCSAGNRCSRVCQEVGIGGGELGGWWGGDFVGDQL